jgi:hypothetical protein
MILQRGASFAAFFLAKIGKCDASYGEAQQGGITFVSSLTTKN